MIFNQPRLKLQILKNNALKKKLMCCKNILTLMLNVQKVKKSTYLLCSNKNCLNTAIMCN
jgi:hypothetical protein